MDGSQFDSIARSLGMPRTRRTIMATLGAALGGTALNGLVADAKKKKKKKKKKPCATKCPGGCCTSKYGSCIQSIQQSAALCGFNGEICRTDGCPGTCTVNRPCPSGQCCSGAGTCGACLTFVTSAKRNGNLGGLAGADAVCQSLAGGAGLPGTYMAWLSDTTGSPLTRFTKAGVPYTLVDGTPIAQNWVDLTSGTIDHTLNLTETGVAISTAQNAEGAWSSTGANGAILSISPKHCQNWSSSSQVGRIGRPGETDSYWTDDGTSLGNPGCGFESRLYCFQQS
ncbi:MAG: hypothetical protein QM692_25055 [Thermomicrobiales bacterium]